MSTSRVIVSSKPPAFYGILESIILSALCLWVALRIRSFRAFCAAALIYRDPTLLAKHDTSSNLKIILNAPILGWWAVHIRASSSFSPRPVYVFIHAIRRLRGHLTSDLGIQHFAAIPALPTA